MKTVKIFVSHSHNDNDFCESLVHSLRNAGADVWYDEHNLGAGVLLQEINRQMLDRPIFIVILSKAALFSQWVRAECEWAYTLYMQDPSRVILPIVVEKLDQQDLNALLFITGFKRIEAAGYQPHPPQQAIQKTLQALVLNEPVTPRKGFVEPHILWVDDRPSNNLYERRYLEELGIQFTISTSTDDAIGKVVRGHYGKTQFDTIISDMGRPPDSMAGYTLLEVLQRLGYCPPFIIYSGSNDPKHETEAIKRGAIGSVGNDSRLFELIKQTLHL